MADIEEEVNLKSGSLRTDKKKKIKKLLKKEADAAEMAEVGEEANRTVLQVETNLESGHVRMEKKKKRKVVLLKEALAAEMAETEEGANRTTLEEEANLEPSDVRTDKKKKRKKLLLLEATATEMAEIEEEANMTTLKEEAKLETSDARMDKKKKRKKLLLKEAAAAEKHGICYLSRIPPRMDPLKLRQILSQYGEIQRIYLTPEDPAAQVYRKRAGGFRGQEFSEGWVEFSKKSVAKRVAKMLNGEQIGGKKRSLFYYDLWNIKYLSKFRWDDLTEEIAFKNAIREQKLALELSAAKRERDLYLSKVDQSRALTSIQERIKKKQKVQNELGMASELAPEQLAPKVIRQFPQTRPVGNAEKSKPRLSKDILAGVFGGS